MDIFNNKIVKFKVNDALSAVSLLITILDLNICTIKINGVDENSIKVKITYKESMFDEIIFNDNERKENYELNVPEYYLK